MNALKISVVTPSFNSENTIRESIESVRAQSYKNWEHLVMDGGSKDSTVSILQEYKHLMWISKKDEGHYHAMNKGIAKATGDLIVILNSDDCFLPKRFKQLKTLFKNTYTNLLPFPTDMHILIQLIDHTNLCKSHALFNHHAHLL